MKKIMTPLDFALFLLLVLTSCDKKPQQPPKALQ